MQNRVKKYRLKNAFSSRPNTPVREDADFFNEQQTQAGMDLDEMTQLEDRFQNLNLKRKRDSEDAISPMEDGENNLESKAPAAKKACLQSISMRFSEFGGLQATQENPLPLTQETFFSKPRSRFTLVRGVSSSSNSKKI